MNGEAFLKNRLTMAYDSGRQVVAVAMDHYELLWLIDLIERKEKPEKTQEYLNGYDAGFEQGYQKAIVEVAKVVKGLKSYGGGNKEGYAAGHAGDEAKRAEDLQRQLRGTGAHEKHGEPVPQAAAGN